LCSGENCLFLLSNETVNKSVRCISFEFYCLPAAATHFTVAVSASKY
jgi:hypothetical protein